MNVGSFFSGCGLLDLGLTLAGLEHRWLCEVDPFRRELLGRRWPGVRVFDDVRAVGADSAERVAVIAGGVPCKGASTAGKRDGFDNPETVLWREMRRAVGELRPRFVVVENVANLLAVGDGAVWGEILGDLAALGFDVEWDCFPAAAFGAPHLRDRLIAVATHTDEPRGGAGREHGLTGRGEYGSGRRNHAQPGAEAPADAGRDGLRIEPEPERRRSASPEPPRAGQAAADADGGRLDQQSQLNGASPARGEHLQAGGDAVGRGVRVEWGTYGPAIRRWEAIHGPAPEPLVRRMDDRRAARVERSRLSALGDGVQVQLGFMVGRFLMQLRSEEGE